MQLLRNLIKWMKPKAEELEEAQLALNLKDRTIWSKDANGLVFPVTGDVAVVEDIIKLLDVPQNKIAYVLNDAYRGGLYKYNTTRKTENNGIDIILGWEKKENPNYPTIFATYAAMVQFFNVTPAVAVDSEIYVNSDSYIQNNGKMEFNKVEVIKTLPVADIPIPVYFNNQLNAKIISDGTKAKIDKDVFVETEDAIFKNGNHYYIDSKNGLDTNDGLTGLTAKKRLYLLLPNIVYPATIHFMNDIEDYNVGGFSSVKVNGDIKFIGKTSGSRTLLTSMDANQNNTFTLTDKGVYVSSGWSAAPKSMFNMKVKDKNNMATACEYVTTIEKCLSKENTYYFDSAGNKLYINTIDGEPPIFGKGNLVYSAGNQFFYVQQQLTNTTIVFENIDFLFFGVASSFKAKSSDLTTPNTNKLYMKNCNVYGSRANAFEILNYSIIFMKNCNSQHVTSDGFNYHSYVDGAHGAGEWMTVYEDNCQSFYSGYGGFSFKGNIGSSSNGSTAHDGINIVRASCSYTMSHGAVVADVNGATSLNYNVSAGQSFGGAPLASFLHIGDVGRAGKMLLWMCASESYSNSVDIATQAAGDIEIQGWTGDTKLKISGDNIVKTQ